MLHSPLRTTAMHCVQLHAHTGFWLHASRSKPGARKTLCVSSSSTCCVASTAAMKTCSKSRAAGGKEKSQGDVDEFGQHVGVAWHGLRGMLLHGSCIALPHAPALAACELALALALACRHTIGCPFINSSVTVWLLCLRRCHRYPP